MAITCGFAWLTNLSNEMNSNRVQLLQLFQHVCKQSITMAQLLQINVIPMDLYEYINAEIQPSKKGRLLYDALSRLTYDDIKRTIAVFRESNNIILAEMMVGIVARASNSQVVLAAATRAPVDSAMQPRAPVDSSVLQPLVDLVNQIQPISAEDPRSSIRQLVRSYNLCNLQLEPFQIAHDKIGMVMCACAGMEQSLVRQWISDHELQSASPIMESLKKSAHDLLLKTNGGNICIESDKFADVAKGIPGAIKCIIERISNVRKSIQIKSDRIRILIKNASRKNYSDVEWNVLTVVTGVTLTLPATSFCIVKMMSNIPAFLYTPNVLDMTRVADVLQPVDIDYMERSLHRDESCAKSPMAFASEPCPF